jgi:membrane protein DedA with SNARE-associated domain
VEEHPASGNASLRRPVFWIVVGASAMLLVVVCAATLLAIFDGDDTYGVLEGHAGFLPYFAVFGLIFGDAVVPILPGETTLNTAAVLASQGSLDISWVIVAAALGAIVGDSALYWISRTGPTRLKARFERAQDDPRVAKAVALLGESGPLLIAGGRFVPGVRFAVNVSMGLLEYPYRRFLLWSSIGGTIWAVYTALLAYYVGTALSEFPLASIAVSGFVTSVLIAGVYWIDRRRRGTEQAPPPSAITHPEEGIP